MLLIQELRFDPEANLDVSFIMPPVVMWTSFYHFDLVYLLVETTDSSCDSANELMCIGCTLKALLLSSHGIFAPTNQYLKVLMKRNMQPIFPWKKTRLLQMYLAHDMGNGHLSQYRLSGYCVDIATFVGIACLFEHYFLKYLKIFVDFFRLKSTICLCPSTQNTASTASR